MAEGTTSHSGITQLLQAWDGGDPSAFARVIPLMIDDLRRISRGQLARERANHTLQPTALINELYLRWSRQERFGWLDRAHFLRLAAAQMRRILVEHARKKQARKRGPALTMRYSTLGGLACPGDGGEAVDLLDLERVLVRLHEMEPRYCQIVELRFFAGLTIREVAEVLGTTERTVMRHWAWTRAWLFNQLQGQGHPAS